MERDAKVIDLQAQLLEKKDDQLQALASSVQTAVRDTVEKSWCDVASRNVVQTQPVPVISSTVIHRVVKDFTTFTFYFTTFTFATRCMAWPLASRGREAAERSEGYLTLSLCELGRVL